MPDSTTQVALKEWAVAVRAMEDGLQDVIFRKGGIQEPEGDFRLAHDEFLLYPAREHQKEQFLKSEYLGLFAESRAEQQGHLVCIRSKAVVLQYHLVHTLEETLPYFGRHVWNNDFVQMRLDYKPEQPLYVIELQVVALPIPIEFVESTEQAGCKSWISVTVPV